MWLTSFGGKREVALKKQKPRRNLMYEWDYLGREVGRKRIPGRGNSICKQFVAGEVMAHLRVGCENKGAPGKVGLDHGGPCRLFEL